MRDKESRNFFSITPAKSYRHPEALAAQRRASKDRLQAISAPTVLAAILRDAALTRGPQDDGGV
jgi:hypothetical protein